jgi:hypothetical protein
MSNLHKIEERLSVLTEPKNEINLESLKSKTADDRLGNNIYYQPKKIIIDKSNPRMVLGVFATEKITKGELIERCPMIQMVWRGKYHGDPQISNYLYSNVSCQCKECQSHGPHMFMVLGYGMMYNHQDDPNTVWSFNYQNLIADVISTKEIHAGEEIFVSYGNRYFTDSSREKYTI